MDAMIDVGKWTEDMVQSIKTGSEIERYLLEQARKATLFDLWEEVHKLKTIFDFDSTQSAEDLIQDLKNIIKDFKQ